MPIEVIGKELIDTEIQILKESICPSLSGRSSLSYQIGSTPDSQFRVRIIKNSGNGIFSNEWVRLDNIISALKERKESFSWNVLCPLFEKQSVNTAGFLMALLLAEGLVQPLERRYELLNAEEYLAEIKGSVPKTSKAKTPKKTGNTKSRSAA